MLRLSLKECHGDREEVGAAQKLESMIGVRFDNLKLN